MDRGEALCVDCLELAEVVPMIEAIIVYSLLMWGCWLCAQCLTLEVDT